MRLLFEPAPVYFLHIPKTGGIALGRWLSAGYGRGYFDLGILNLAGLGGRDPRRYRCYHAWHHGRGLYDWLARPDLAVVTMLRHPIERVVSSFSHLQRLLVEDPGRYTPAYRQSLAHLPGRALADCLEGEPLTGQLSNGQVRLLGAYRDYAAFLADLQQPGSPERLLRPFNIPYLTPPDDLPQLYANARAWLNEMTLVGLTERYRESLLLLADLLGLPPPAELPYINVNPQRSGPAMCYRDSLSPAARARLEELNRHDLELYAEASERFEQQWARYQSRPLRRYSIAAYVRSLRPGPR